MQIYYRSPDAAVSGIYAGGRELLKSASQSDKAMLERFISGSSASQALADVVSARILALSDSQAQVLSHDHALMLSAAPKGALQIDLGWLSNAEDVTRLSDPVALRRLLHIGERSGQARICRAQPINFGTQHSVFAPPIAGGGRRLDQWLPFRAGCSRTLGWRSAH